MWEWLKVREYITGHLSFSYSQLRGGSGSAQLGAAITQSPPVPVSELQQAHCAAWAVPFHVACPWGACPPALERPAKALKLLSE